MYLKKVLTSIIFVKDANLLAINEFDEFGRYKKRIKLLHSKAIHSSS